MPASVLEALTHEIGEVVAGHGRIVTINASGKAVGRNQVGPCLEFKHHDLESVREPLVVLVEEDHELGTGIARSRAPGCEPEPPRRWLLSPP